MRSVFAVTVPNAAIDFPELNQHGGDVHLPRHTQSAAQGSAFKSIEFEGGLLFSFGILA